MHQAPFALELFGSGLNKGVISIQMEKVGDKMKRSGILISVLAFLVIPSVVQAEVVAFTPAGTSTVSQSTNLYWDMVSRTTSTTSFGAVGNFYLSDHGDIHYDTSQGASMVRVGATDGGDLLPAGTLIDASSNWASSGFVGTTDYDGTMVPPQTAYFGLRFQVAGQTHYGWVQIEEGTGDQSVLAWGYETTPNVAIAAGAGSGSGAPSEPIPTLSEWALIIMASLLAVFGATRIRRRRTPGG